jgi:hypothetical protein
MKVWGYGLVALVKVPLKDHLNLGKGLHSLYLALALGYGNVHRAYLLVLCCEAQYSKHRYNLREK